MRIIFLVTEDWYFISHRLAVARAARDSGCHVTVVTRDNGFGARIESEGFDLRPVDMRRGKVGVISEGGTIVLLRKIFHDTKPDIIHNIGIKAVLLGGIAAQISGVRGVVNTFGGLGYIFSSNDLRVRLLKAAVSFALRVIISNRRGLVTVQNSFDYDAVKGLGIPEGRISLIPGSGVDLEVCHPSTEPVGIVVVAMVARMLRTKGVEDLVNASRIIRQRGLDIRILLVGEPDQENPSTVSRDELRTWTREGCVEWLGKLPGDEIPALWQRSHVAVLPTYYGEGVPKALLEAGACGRALIATDMPGCNDVIVHESTGLLVPPRDPASLADAIIRLAEDSKLRQRLGAAARERIVEKFSEEIVVGRTLDGYRAVLSEMKSRMGS